jgi:nucleotide-binding universal stress UspA family protein
MTTVLVGVDASERSLDAVAFARQVATVSEASVLVASAFPYDDHPSRAANREYRQALESAASQTVRRASAELDELGEGRVRTAVVARHSPAHGLHDLAEAERAELVVVGSSHVGAAGRVMPGSTGERLLHGAPCAVAIVPDGYRKSAHELRSVGVAYDGSPEARAALRAGAALARATGAELRVIRVLARLAPTAAAVMGGASFVLLSEDNETELRAELDDVVSRFPEDVSAHAAFVTGDPAHELVEQSGTLDLLITGSRGYGPLRAVMVGGVTGRVIQDAACPVVVIPRGVESPLELLYVRHATVERQP